MFKLEMKKTNKKIEMYSLEEQEEMKNNPYKQDKKSRKKTVGVFNGHQDVGKIIANADGGKLQMKQRRAFDVMNPYLKTQREKEEEKFRKAIHNKHLSLKNI